MAALANEVLNLSDLREVAKRELGVLMDGIQNGGDKSKCVILDPSLVEPLKYSGVTADVFKKERGVTAIFPLMEKAEMISDARSLVFFVRPSVELMRHVAAHILAVVSRFPKTFVYVYFVPRKSLICQHLLSNEYRLAEKCSNNLQFGEFDLDLLPLDDDLLSMELRDCFKDLYLDGDQSVLHTVAKSIMKLQAGIFGPIPLIRAKGTHAAKVLSILRRLTHEVGADFTAENTPEIEAMYIVDRSVDMQTPLMTQLTYEGLIEELYGINAGHFEAPPEMAAPPPGADAAAVAAAASGAPRRIPLNSGDRMFAEARDKNFSAVANTLKAKALWVKQSYDRRKEVQHLKDLREFMRGLPEMQELHRLIGVHTDIAGIIGRKTQSVEFRRQISVEQSIIQQSDERQALDLVEDLINKGESLTRVLRLLCLLSLTNGGLKPRIFDSIRESMMLSYGIPQIITAMQHLERTGLLTKQSGSRQTFPQLRRVGRLWVEDLNEAAPNDIAYAYSGYASLLVRVVEAMADPSGRGWNSEVVDQAPGEKAELVTEAEVAGGTRIVVVFVIGGVTHAEISALRFVASRSSDVERPRNIIIATTNIISGNKLFNSLLPFPERS